VLSSLNFNSSNESPVVENYGMTEYGYDLCSTYNESCTLGPGGTCPHCSAPVATNRRVRRNIFALDLDEYSKIVSAMWEMKNLPMEVGRDKYGVAFKTYDYFHAKHIAQAEDLRGDRSQTNIVFSIWHACLTLEFENTLLAIDPSIGAVPYWNWNETLNPFNDTYFGSAPGTGERYEVIDGPFAYWPVADMNESLWNELYVPYMRNSSGIDYSGETASGKFRQYLVCDSQDYMVRYGEKNTDFAGGTTGPIDCSYHGLFPWYKYHVCIDFYYVTERDGHETGNYHKSPHLDVGGTQDPYPYTCTGPDDFSYGDFTYGAYSITDPIFMFHHVNMVREMHSWQENNADTAACYYGFTYNGYCCDSDGSRTEADCIDLGLMDYLSEYWCFTDEDLQIYIHDSPHECWKIHEAICYLQYNTAPYTFDNYLTW